MLQIIEKNMPQVQAVIEISKIGEEDINKYKHETGLTELIPYRDWETLKKPQKVYKVPIEYIKFRLENGRIKSKVLTYQKNHGKLDAEDQDTQDLLSQFLEELDQNTNQELLQILKKEGQKQPAIITADGFLINGNRRKWALQTLFSKTKDPKYKFMNVCILPGTDNEALRPTPMDIALLETRYQMQKSGKSEYKVMDTALTYQEHINTGIELETLLRDDPTFNADNPKEFEKQVNDFKKKYLEPLKLVNDYLKINKIPGEYNLVANRWESFVETHKNIVEKFKSPKQLNKLRLKEEDIGKVINAAFNVIKIEDVREIKPRRTDIIRDIASDYLEVGKKDVFSIAKIEPNVSRNEDPIDAYEKWQKNEGEEVLNKLKALKNMSQQQKDKETPLAKLANALNSLNSKGLDLSEMENMTESDAKEALSLTNEIESINKTLQSFFYNKVKKNQKRLKALIDKFNADKLN